MQRLLSAVLLAHIAGCDAPSESDSDPTATQESGTQASQLDCVGTSPLLSVRSEGGFFEAALQPKLMPYGHLTWVVDGKCRARRYEARTRGIPGSILGSALPESALPWTKRLADNPLLAKYNNVRFPAPDATCEGSTVRITNRKGSFRCDCSCEPNFVDLPEELRAFVDELNLFRERSHPQLQPLPAMDLGLIAINQSSPLWYGHLDQVPDAHWKKIDLPIDLKTMALLNPGAPIRSSNASVNAQLRSLLSEHQAWQPSHIDPNWMYLRDTSGQRVVLGIVELIEPLTEDP